MSQENETGGEQMEKLAVGDLVQPAGETDLYKLKAFVQGGKEVLLENVTTFEENGFPTEGMRRVGSGEKANPQQTGITPETLRAEQANDQIEGWKDRKSA